MGFAEASSSHCRNLPNQSFRKIMIYFALSDEANVPRAAISAIACDLSSAEAMCRAYQAKGGACFVRVGQGDQVARWARNDRQLASR